MASTEEEASIAQTGSKVLLQQTSVQKMRLSVARHGVDQHAQLNQSAREDGSALADADVLDSKPGILVHDGNHGLVGAVDAAESEWRALRSLGVLGNHDHFLAGHEALEARVEGLSRFVDVRGLA